MNQPPPMILGMEMVVATVSGYHGTHRFDLIKLISLSGANYVGSLSPSTTHLVCWKFQGRKYKLAKRLGIIIVNHRWVEDCIEQGTRVPEHPYTFQSGEEIGPLLLEVPIIDNSKFLDKKSKVLFDKSNICCDAERQTAHLHHKDWGFIGLNDSSLSNQVPKCKSACKLKSYQSKLASEPKDLLHGDYLSEDIPVSRLLGSESEGTDSYSSIHSARRKRKILRHEKLTNSSKMSWALGKSKVSDDDFGSISVPESSCRRQRHAKKAVDKDLWWKMPVDSAFDERDPVRFPNKNDGGAPSEWLNGKVHDDLRKTGKKAVGKDHLESIVLDSDDDFYPIRFHEKNDAAAPSEQLDGQLNDAICDTGGTFLQSFNSSVGTTSGAFETDRNVLFAKLTRSPEDILRSPESADGCSITNSLDGKKKNVVDRNALLTRYPEDIQRLSERTDGCSTINNLEGKIKNAAQADSTTRPPTSLDMSCVICWTEFSPTRGILPCGHRFCFSCIQQWAAHMASMRKISTCPLCKASFVSITKVEDAATNDQKIYSQTIPSNSSTTGLLQFVDLQTNRSGSQSSIQWDCCGCHCREPEDLLIWCDFCHNRCIHSYCLDPMLLPWICVPCKELEMFYHRTR